MLAAIQRSVFAEQAERYRSELVQRERARGDPDGFAMRYAPEVMTIHPDGTFTIDHETLEQLIAPRR